MLSWTLCCTLKDGSSSESRRVKCLRAVLKGKRKEKGNTQLWSKSKVLKCNCHMFYSTCGTWTFKLIKDEYSRLEGKGHEVMLDTVLSFVTNKFYGFIMQCDFC